LLHDFADLNHSRTHLIDTPGLLPRSCGYLFNQPFAVCQGTRNLRKFVVCSNDQIITFFDLFNGILQETGSALRGPGSSHCKVFHLIGHNCESRSRLPGPCSLHRGIEGENLGLKSNLIYGLDDLLRVL
jgi:hypothetical protein